MKKRLLSKILLLVVVGIAVGLIKSSSVAADPLADYNQIPTTLPSSPTNGTGPSREFINISDSLKNNPDGTGVYHRGADIMVYTNNLTGQNHKVRVTFNWVYRNDTNCDTYANDYVLWNWSKLNSNETWQSDSQDFTFNLHSRYVNNTSCSPGQTTEFDAVIPDSAFTPSNLPEHQGIFVAALTIRIPFKTNTHPYSYFMDLDARSFPWDSNPDTRLGFRAGGYYEGSVIYPEQYSSTNHGDYTVRMPFQPSCNNPPQNDLIWGDDDVGTANQDPSYGLEMHMLVYNARDTATSGGVPPGGLIQDYPIAKDGGAGASRFSGLYGSKTFQLSWISRSSWVPGERYVLEFRHVEGGNGIWLQPPYNSGNANFSCNNTSVHVAVDPAECGSKWITGIAWKDNGSNLPFNGMAVDIYYNLPGGQPPDVTVTANQPSRPADSGNAGNTFFNNYVYSALVPDLYRDGFPHTFYIYARDPSNASIRGGPATYTEVGCQVQAVNVSSSTFLKPDPENPTAYNTVSNFTLQDISDANFQPVINMSQCQVNVTKTTGALTVPWPPSYSCVGAYPVNNSNQTYTSPDGNPAPFAAGTNFCSTISLYQSGFVYRGDNKFIGTNYGPIGGNCDHVINEPYVHVLGSDAQAGGGFGSGCTVSPGGIKTYLKRTGVTPTGSGVQIGALSIGPISGFSSAILRGATPTGSTGLSFSNTDNITGGLGDAPNEGGNLGNNHCVTDYFSKKPSSTATSTANATTTNLANGTPAAKNVTQYYEPSGGTLTISGGTIDDQSNLAIFVKGDVRITGPIKFTNASWGTIERIPSFYLIVKGNIYIDKSVGQLDGMYIAQPNGATGGTINTCANGSAAFSPGALLSNCKSQLVVNGSFVAQHVYLERSFGSVRNAYPGEHLTGATYNCTDSGNTPYGDCAAEIFNFSPELYLAQPAFTQSTGPTTGKYDYVTSLAPVL
jgi:hypothetical protein